MSSRMRGVCQLLAPQGQQRLGEIFSQILSWLPFQISGKSGRKFGALGSQDLSKNAEYIFCYPGQVPLGFLNGITSAPWRRESR
jgi:hypothetical protein